MTSHFLHFFMLEFTKSTLLLTNVKLGGVKCKTLYKILLDGWGIGCFFNDMLDCLFVIKTAD